MKRHIIFASVASLLSFQIYALEQKDLEWLLMLNKCEKCDLSQAELKGIDLDQANLSGAILRKVNFNESSLLLSSG